MTCECIAKVDELLKPHNTRLQLLLILSGPNSELPYIGTEQIEKGRGKPKAKTMFPSFCPFCGTKYRADEVENSAAA
ncbi:hypothetical protein C8D77_111114 [Mesorhizobium loti]|uniref:Uncharacterized protein n=1 Tax=Rhizobium loti TaxID=381 RepID=A0A8E3B301_RHILI|nr:hypothetical protein [Mesorhizobium loti]PWJ88391.1 hypothetical protein C8D77_111114 [Mesorhizobium loti]